MSSRRTYWLIDGSDYMLFGLTARRVNRFSWRLPGQGLVRATPLSPKIQQLIEEGEKFGEATRIEVTTGGGLRLMLEQQLSSTLLANATCISTCLLVPLKVMGKNRELIIWSPEESRTRFEVVIADQNGAKLTWS